VGLPGVPVLLVWPLLAGVLGLPGVPVLLVWPLLAGMLTLPFWPAIELVVSAPHPAVIAAAITSMVGKVYETSEWRAAPQIILEITHHPHNGLLKLSSRATDCVKVFGVPLEPWRLL
jgi:hypothetical protein